MKAEDWPEIWPCRLLSLTENEDLKRSHSLARSCSGQCRHAFLMLHILEQSAGADVNSEADFEIVLRMWASDLGLSVGWVRCCIHELVRWFDRPVGR